MDFNQGMRTVSHNWSRTLPAVDRYLANPYPGWAPGEAYFDDVTPGGLLDVAAARVLLTTADQARGAGAYSWALPLGTMAGTRAQFFGAHALSFSTYGYLGLNGDSRIQAAAMEAVARWGTSTGGVRMLTGTTELHRETESALATWLGTDDTLLFSSGYDANLSAVSTLFGRRDVVVADHLAHRSLVEGIKLSGAKSLRFQHNDIQDLARKLVRAGSLGERILIVVDGVYSMDGDLAPLQEIVNLKQHHGAFLLVDDSHALGVIGDTGRGTADALGVDPRQIDILTSSLGKAFPSTGGLIAGSRALITFLRHAAAPSMFSSAISAVNVAAVKETVDILRTDPEPLRRLWRNTALLHEIVAEAGFAGHGSRTPIVPVVLGDATRCVSWAVGALREWGVYLSSVQTPAVAEGQARLRLCATAAQTPEQLARLREALLGLRAAEQAGILQPA